MPAKGDSYATPCCTRTQEFVGLVAPAMEVGSSLAVETGRAAQEQWPPVHPGSTPSYGISFIKCRGSCWQPRRLAAFVSSLCGRVSSTWQPGRSDQKKSDLGFVSVAGHLAKGQPSFQMHAGPSPFLEYRVCKGRMIHVPPHPGHPISLLAQGLSGRGPGSDTLSKLCCRTPSPTTAKR